VAFVAMVYNMNGILLRDKVPGNAKDWVNATNEFDVYRNGESGILPQKGDVFVWTDGDYGHVGVVGDISNKAKRLIMYNANTPHISYSFEYRIQNNKIEIITEIGQSSRSAPSYWLHKK
jgi:surface antigen